MTRDSLQRIHNRNTVLNAFGEGMWGFASAFHNFQSVIPVFLAQMGAATWLIGMVPGGFILLMAIPQLVSATLFRTYPNVKRLNILLHFAILPVVIGIVICFFFLRITGSTGVLVYMLLAAGYALSIGWLIPVWADFLASVALPHRRGRFMGITFMANAVLAMAGGYGLKVILENAWFPFPANFGFGWLIMAVAIAIGSSMFFFMTVIEKPRTITDTDGSALRRIFRIYRENGPFRQYIYSRMLVAAAMMPLAFYAIDLQDRFALPLSSTGTFTFFLVMGTALFNLLFGHLGDRRGRKFAVTFHFVAHLAAILTTLFLDFGWTPYLVFIFIGMANGVAQSNFMVYVYEFAGESGDRKLHYAALDTAVAPVLLLYILSAGPIVETWGYGALYSVAGILVSLGLILFVWKVPDPRRDLDAEHQSA